MHLPALRYFLAVARVGSIRQASEELHVAPSAISRQIANLEEDYGAALFERHAQGVRLTLAGEISARHARSTLREFERVRSDIDDVRGLKRGNVKIAVVEGVVANFLLPTIAAFHARYPDITFEIDVAGTQAILDSIARDDADLGIVFHPTAHPDVEVRIAVQHSLVAAVPPGHPLAGRGRLVLGDLRDCRLGLLHRSFGTRQLFEHALAEAGVHLAAS